jgi:hypothetical protein
MVVPSESRINQPPSGFAPLASSCEFVNRAGAFFSSAQGTAGLTIGTWIGADQADAFGNADRGFLLTFGDFALTEATQGITLRLSADSLGAAQVGDWIEARVTPFAGDAGELIFAGAVIQAGTRPLMRLHGAFFPFKKRSRSE